MPSTSDEDGGGSGTTNGAEEDSRYRQRFSFSTLNDESRASSSQSAASFATAAPLSLSASAPRGLSIRWRSSTDSSNSYSSATNATEERGRSHGESEEVRRQRAAIRSFRQRVASVVQDMEGLQIQADRQAQHQIDADIEQALRGSLRGISRKWHRRVLQACEDLVPAQWAIEDKDSLIKQMRNRKPPALRDAEWDEESVDEAEYWRGPSAEEVFGEDRIIETRTPYELLAVYTRRTWATSVPSAFVRSHKAAEKSRWRWDSCEGFFSGTALVRKTLPTQAVLRSSVERDLAADGSGSGEASAESRASQVSVHPHGAGHGYESAIVDGTEFDSDVRIVGQCAQACLGCRPRPSPFPLAALHAQPPVGYGRAPVEDENVRIPSRLEDFLFMAHVPIKRPPWDSRKTPLLSTLEVKRPKPKQHEGPEVEGENMPGAERQRGGTMFFSGVSEDFDMLPRTGAFESCGNLLARDSVYHRTDMETLRQKEDDSPHVDKSASANEQSHKEAPSSPDAASQRYSSDSLDSFEDGWDDESLQAQYRQMAEQGLWIEPDAIGGDYPEGWEEAEYPEGSPYGEDADGEVPSSGAGPGDFWVARKFREVCDRLVPEVQEFCRIPQKLRDSVSAVKHETENCIFDQADVQVLEYWHLQRDAGKPVWVYEGLQWDFPKKQVPMDVPPAAVKVVVPPEPDKTGPKQYFEKSMLYLPQAKARDFSKAVSSSSLGDWFSYFGPRTGGEGPDIKGLVL
ncbi:hypothetical protein TGGT1_224000 [Toxoplasma gondii GT1]|uniref:Uncharacterized protein n=2 Tax=Toxoplasma gondii TaxID=5811 RepID=S7UW65_TOXGG|nr:hypothetical protein TGGT1_224000 [Toxoplasma gondii GT1]KAF4640453.1 hypothetical protein TGRH88_043790 [Toxoplasma gondii]